MGNRNKKILFYDTTLRDGSQAEGISLSSHDKVLIAKRLDQFGIHYIEGGWPGSNPKDMEFFHMIKKAGIKCSKIAAFGSIRYHLVEVLVLLAVGVARRIRFDGRRR